jgi:hypothetical protein
MWKITDESMPLVFQPVIAISRIKRGGSGPFHDTNEQAKKEELSMLAVK